MRHDDQLGMAQIFAHRISGDPQRERNVLNDLPCTANSCILFTVLLLIMAASCVHAEPHAPQLTAKGGQFIGNYKGLIRRALVPLPAQNTFS